MRRLKACSVALAALLLVLSCRPEPAGLAPGAPRLVLFLVIDQGRYDYLERFRPLLKHGLHRLLEESVSFTDAHHDHARTTTSPGHATLSTGAYPARHGIIDNFWYDRSLGERVYSAMDNDEERSPERLLASTLGDWLKTASPRSKVFTASAKDRAAVLTAGRRADAAFWFDRETGEFTTAPFYRWKGSPWWEGFHQEHHPDRLYGTLWEPLPEVAENAAEYDIEPLDRGLINPQFPHPLGSAQPAPGSSFYNAVYSSPFADAYLAELGEALIAGEELGADDDPDFLGLSFSALDGVGHEYGPHSPELLDTLLRLDRAIGAVLDFVDERVGLDKVIVSLSSDHGVAPIPELLASRGIPARRFGAEEITCVQRAGAVLEERFGEGDWISYGLYLDHELAEERGVAVNDLEAALALKLAACPGFVRVWTATELSTGTDEDPMTRLYRHSFHPERSADLAVMLEPHAIASSSEATHGSPHPYDTWVPWLLRLPEGRAAEVDERVHTVDVAPTVAGLIGLEPPAEIDGVDRGSLLRQGASERPPEGSAELRP